MKETGIVKSVSGEFCQVAVLRKSACGENCASCKGGCKPQAQLCTAKNTPSAKVGDRVIIEIDSSTVLKSAFLLYIMPIIVFFSAYFLCGKFSETIRISVSFLATALVFLRLFFLDKRRKNQYISQVTEILEPKN